MKIKKSFLICMILLVIFSLGVVCAEDNTISDDLGETTQSDEQTSIDNIELTSKSNANTLNEDNEITSGENDLNPLNTNASTYSQLSKEIGEGGNITLKHAYYTYDSGDSIEITEDNSLINGNGAIIDMAGSHIRAFTVSASKVTIKNLTIKNANEVYFNGIGIYFKSYGSVENCNFVNNTAYNGGALYFSENGKVTNCNFTNNTAYNGGALYFSENGEVTNCNFTNNTAYNGGALYFSENGEVTNCNFTNNTADKGGTLYFRENGKVTNCNFTNNKATDYGRGKGGAIYFNNHIEVTNCNFVNNAADEGGAIDGPMGKVTNCNFVNNTADYSGAICIMGLCEITNCNFTNNSADNIGAVYIPMYGKIADCNFINNTASTNAGAVCISLRGEVTNCNFVNNTGNRGGAINIDENVEVTNCNFTNNYALYGGAIGVYDNSNVRNCNFDNDTAYYDGGAIYYDWACFGTVENCSFKNCYDENANAIYGLGITVINCNFTNDTINNPSKHRIRNGTVTLNITFYDHNHTYKRSNFFGFMMPNDLEYKPTVLIDGKPYRNYECYISDPLWPWGGYSDTQLGHMVEFFDLKPGNHNVTISYMGDSKYSSCSFNKTITVNDAEPEIIASDVNVTYSAGTYYKIKVYKDNGDPADNVVVKISGKISKKLKTKNGIAQFKVDQIPGKYKITISSLGKSVTKTITVNHIITLKTITIKKSVKKLTLQASLAKVNGKYLKNKQITFKFNGKTYKTKTNSKGIAKVTIPKSVLNKLKSGQKVTYQATYLKDTVKQTATVDKIGTATFDIEFCEFNYTYGESGYLGFLMPNDLEYKPTVQIDGKPYSIYEFDLSTHRWIWGNGNPKTQVGYSLILRHLKSGPHKMIVSYSGDLKYASCLFNKKIIIHDAEPKIITSNVKVTYSADTYYKIKVYKGNGEPANNEVVKVSGNISKKLKTKNGIAQFKVDQMPGKYKITISSLGKSVTKTITVNHIITLKTITVKKSAKKLTLQASLAKVNGKYLKNKKITFKFNDKTYKTKTNSKGIAKVTIPKSVLSKLKVGKKVTYQATYLKDTVQKTAIVKK